ncbi:MAG: VacB/RNase II family 3'-5' exoribonuclease, partial [Zetaproteobacteria bacterium]
RRDMKGREDLRALLFVTIDGEDAKDFDDAVFVRRRGQGFEAWVAIADVAHYVPRDSALDKEARARGNSFYFPDRVLPMLPEKLSNGLCSLNPRVNRLAMVVRMRMDASGKIVSHRIMEGVIRSRARLTYTQVSDWLEKRDARAIPDAAIRAMLDDAHALYQKLIRRREARGALDLDVPEVRALLHEGRVAGLAVRERRVAHRIIEELMLAANVTVAKELEARGVPFMYRVHPPPELDAIESLNAFLKPFGLFIPIKKRRGEAFVDPKDVQAVLKASEGKPFAHVLHKLVLRAMQQARYSPDNEGHFGLAYRSYCHFTSPIRRYADLTVHRRLKAILRGEDPD